MIRHLPGTVTEAQLSKKGEASTVLAGIFVTKGLVLSQVCELSGIEPYTVQNWIKRGFCSPPQNKKYTKRQFCRLLIINTFKDILPLSDIIKLISYINGSLCDESDDLVPDDEIYCAFTDALSMMWDMPVNDESVKTVAKTVSETSVYADKLSEVIAIMINAYFAEELRKKSITEINGL